MPRESPYCHTRVHPGAFRAARPTHSCPHLRFPSATLTAATSCAAEGWRCTCNDSDDGLLGTRREMGYGRRCQAAQDGCARHRCLLGCPSDVDWMMSGDRSPSVFSGYTIVFSRSRAASRQIVAPATGYSRAQHGEAPSAPSDGVSCAGHQSRSSTPAHRRSLGCLASTASPMPPKS
jgi:hypothetical protein